MVDYERTNHEFDKKKRKDSYVINSNISYAVREGAAVPSMVIHIRTIVGLRLRVLAPMHGIRVIAPFFSRVTAVVDSAEASESESRCVIHVGDVYRLSKSWRTGWRHI